MNGGLLEVEDWAMAESPMVGGANPEGTLRWVQHALLWISGHVQAKYEKFTTRLCTQPNCYFSDLFRQTPIAVVFQDFHMSILRLESIHFGCGELLPP